MHRFPVSVYYEDTDMAGIVYHANYLKYIERARSDLVAGLGLDQSAMRAEGRIFVVRRIEADYLGAARFEDQLQVETRVAETGGVRLCLEQKVVREAQVLFSARVTVVCAKTDGTPTRLPERLRRLHVG